MTHQSTPKYEVTSPDYSVVLKTGVSKTEAKKFCQSMNRGVTKPSRRMIVRPVKKPN